MSEFRKKKLINDVFIVSEDGKYYYLTEREWKRREVDPGRIHEEVKDAVRVGAAVAAIPERNDDPVTSPDPEGTDQKLGLCYLLNISSLRFDR